jgi:signal transduction histidine kinase
MGFMAAHGGDIIAQREPERGGVSFRLRLPIDDTAPAMGEEHE